MVFQEFRDILAVFGLRQRDSMEMHLDGFLKVITVIKLTRLGLTTLTIIWQVHIVSPSHVIMHVQVIRK